MTWESYYETKPIYKVGGKKATTSDPQILIVKAEKHDSPVGEETYRICGYLTGGGMKDREYPKPVEGNSRESAHQRAISMADSKRAKKIKEGYVEDPSILGTPAAFLPLPSLAHRFEKHEKKVQYPCVLQPKLDGCRCLYDPIAGLISRKGEPLRVRSVLNDIEFELSFNDYLDGEMYVHGMPLQDIISLVRSKDALKQNELGLKYYIFDTMDGENDTRTYQERLAVLMSSGLEGLGNIEIVQTKIAHSKEDAEAFYQQCREAGFEGAMVKDLSARYMWGKRHWSTLKMKAVFDSEFEISSVTYDVSPDGENMIAFMCYIEDGSEIFKVTPACTQLSRRLLFSEWKRGRAVYCGKLLTVEYRGRSNSNIPTHAIGKAIREGGI